MVIMRGQMEKGIQGKQEPRTVCRVPTQQAKNHVLRSRRGHEGCGARSKEEKGPTSTERCS
jgi:hypothetical protein